MTIYYTSFPLAAWIAIALIIIVFAQISIVPKIKERTKSSLQQYTEIKFKNKN